MEPIEKKDGKIVLRRSAEYKPPRSWRTWLIGRPLSTADAPHQTIGKLIGLAVFASDALSSTAYATQEMLFILAYAGMAAFSLSFPLAIAIVILLAILTLSYEQTIHAYPNGGGAYIVSRDNLGDLPSQLAAAALLTDYILTVAVSVSSGVAQIVSAFESLYPYRVTIAVCLVFFVMLINLRGVRESGAAFAVPTYFFIFMMSATVIVGLYRYFTHSLGTVVAPPAFPYDQITTGVTVLLILRAFSSGTTALTGIEALSNGIPAFKEPRSDNAGKTLIALSAILGTLLLGITFLSIHIQAIPSEDETIISQFARTAFGGRDVFYLLLIAATTVILILAANTSFAGFPRLSALTAIDGFVPRQFAYRGSRLVYSRGIVALALIASGLIIVFQASVNRLIPLYAIGVFLSFTLSQAGMSHRWWKIGHLSPGVEIEERGSTLRYQPNWESKMVINGVGAVLTAIVTLVFAITKFIDGAWMVVTIIPIMVVTSSYIHRHYRGVAQQLSLENFGEPSRITRNRVILPISGVNRASLAALRYARSISNDVTAVHVMIDPAEAKKVQEKWDIYGDGVRLVIIESSFRLFLEPLLEYIEDIEKHRCPNEVITIVVPQFVPRMWYNGILHNQTALGLRLALLFKKDIIVSDVPYLIE